MITFLQDDRPTSWKSQVFQISQNTQLSDNQKREKPITYMMYSESLTLKSMLKKTSTENLCVLLAQNNTQKKTGTQNLLK